MLPWQPCSPAVTLGRSPKCLSGDLHVVLENSLGASHPNLTCHCQEMGRGWAGKGRVSVVPGSHKYHPSCTNREFIKEPELMPKTPSQKNRGKKRKIANIQDANRNHIRKR